MINQQIQRERERERKKQPTQGLPKSPTLPPRSILGRGQRGDDVFGACDARNASAKRNAAGEQGFQGPMVKSLLLHQYWIYSGGIPV